VFGRCKIPTVQPNVLFCTFADFYEITNVKLLTYRAANPIFVFSLFDYDYLLINKN
jgi:hypothetical protein